MAEFVNHCKNATKSVGAFDTLEKTSPENRVFGDDANKALHFDEIVTALLNKNKETYSAFSDWVTSYPEEYAKDLSYVNSISDDIKTRVDMYNPIYYISKTSEGYGTSKVASNIRIRTGSFQGDTALTIETNIALILSQYEGV